MENKFKLIIVLICSLITNLTAYPSGAPSGVCQSMTPIHGGIQPQNTIPPFQLNVSVNKVKYDEIITINITGSEINYKFKGFIIQARNSNNTAIGEFVNLNTEYVKSMDCNGISSITHSNANLKSNITVEWRSPSNYKGKFHFYVTIVESLPIFWIKVQSTEIEIVSDNDSILTSTSTIQPDINNDILYSGCDNTKTCIGLPAGCLVTKNCQSFGAIIYRDDEFIFEMQSASHAAYIAMALSNDGLMGDDAVIECVNDDGIIRAFASLTEVSPLPYASNRLKSEQSVIRLITSRYDNGKIYCQVARNYLSVVNNITFDMINSLYYILLSSGTSNTPISIGYHDINRASTTKKLNLTEYQMIDIKTKTIYVKLHGAFMITAWIGTSSIGIIAARYFKSSWPNNRQLWGKDQWFIWHILLMVCTWCLTLIGTIFIIIEINGLSETIHGIIGIITVILCFIQPFGGMLRPKPKTKFRPIFNWTHFTNGTLVHVLAIIGIFYAVPLQRAELPEWITQLLIAFISYYIIAHIIFTIINYISDRNKEKVHGDNSMSKVRHGFFGIHILTILTFAIIFIVAVTLLTPS